MDVVDVVKMGVKIVGHLKKLGIWVESEDRQPKCNVEKLWDGAQEARESLLKQKGSDDKARDTEGWRGTLEEVVEGSLEGPLTRSQLEEIVGRRWIAARRFGLKQGDKIRPIDNFSEFFVNLAFGADEKVTMLGVDHAVSWGRAWLEAVNSNGEVDIKDTMGVSWAGKLHKS